MAKIRKHTMKTNFFRFSCSAPGGGSDVYLKLVKDPKLIDLLEGKLI